MIGAMVARRAVSSAFRALSPHDLDGFMSAWRDDGVLMYPGNISASGTFTGKPAVADWCRKFFEQSPEIRFDVQQVCAESIFAMTGINVMTAHWNTYLMNRSGRVGENFRFNWGAA